MRKEKIFFHPIDGTGSLTISWSSGPKGDAIEAKQGNGVGFFSDGGDLLCVIFDEVNSKKDHQILRFDSEAIDLNVKNGRITFSTLKNRPALSAQKKRPRANTRRKKRTSLSPSR